MRIQSPDPQPRSDGEYRAYVNGTAYGKPYGRVYLDEGDALVLADITLDDARRLAKAAAQVERELAAAHARMTAPHGRSELYKGTCQLCGKPEDDELHAERVPCPSVSPDGDACTVTEPGHAWHYGPDEGGGVRRMWSDADAAAAAVAQCPAGLLREGEDWGAACGKDAGHEPPHDGQDGDWTEDHPRHVPDLDARFPGPPLVIAPGGSGGPASLASVAVQPSGFVTADAPALRGAHVKSGGERVEDAVHNLLGIPGGL